MIRRFVQGKRFSIKSDTTGAQGLSVEKTNHHTSRTTPETVITTTCGATSDDLDATMTTPGTRWKGIQ